MTTFHLRRDRRDLPTCTLGVLYLEQLPLYHVLEPPWRDNLPDVSCVAPGLYPLALTLSARFHRFLPEVQGVPGRTGIRAHVGNRVEETKGCQLLGMTASVDSMDQGVLGHSRLAVAQFVGILDVALKAGPCWLHVHNGR